MFDIDKELSAISAKYRAMMKAELQAVELKYYRDKFPNIKIDKLEIVGHNINVNHFVIDYTIDQYNNPTFKFNLCLSTYELPVFADILRRREESLNHFYKYRMLQGFFIKLVEKYYMQYSANDMYTIYKLANSLPIENKYSGFHNWLLTRSYVCDDKGALGTRFKGWPYEKEFRALVK